MRQIRVEKITARVAELVVEANVKLPDDVYQALLKAKEVEDSASGREILQQLLDNAELAGKEKLPLCQDTGLAVFFVELGQQCCLDGDLYAALNEGVRQGYEKGY